MSAKKSGETTASSIVSIEAGAQARCPRCGLKMGATDEDERAHAEGCYWDWVLVRMLAMGEVAITRTPYELVEAATKATAFFMAMRRDLVEHRRTA